MINSIIDGVHKIANHLYKKRGYAITITKEDTATVLEAFLLLTREEAQDKVLNTDTEEEG